VKSVIIGIGIDIIEINRIKDAIIRQSFVEKVFTLHEQQYCESRGVQKASSYAARFAGKEAVMKAFGTGMAGGKLQDIEIFLDDKGCPHVRLSGQFAALANDMGVSMIHISLTHAREYAAAQAILWGGK
jgi:holo-[acyl-carrier protein] synthase